MSLEMKDRCGECDSSLLADGEAWICSYECTYCSKCAEAHDYACSNCSGELTPRPRRVES